MWIIPNTKKFSPYAAEVWDSKEEWNLLAFEVEQSLTWRGKHSQRGTWWGRWKRVWWIKHLFGRMLKPSIHSRFVIEYTASLAVIRVRGKASQENENSNTMNDMFGRIYSKLFQQLDLFSASSRMYTDTLEVHSRKFSQTYEALVTQLNQAYTQREKWALHTLEKDSLSSHTPTETHCGDAWPTPTANRGTYQVSRNGTRRLQLEKAVRTYPTPTALEAEKTVPSTRQNSLTKMALTGQLHQEGSNTNGNIRGLLNPAWVAQLMGTTLDETFCAYTEMPLYQLQQERRGMS